MVRRIWGFWGLGEWRAAGECIPVALGHLFICGCHPPGLIQPIAITLGILEGGGQDLGLTAAQVWCRGDGRGVGCLWRSWHGLLAQQGGRDKAVAILQGWGRDKSRTRSLGACLLL